MPSTSPRSTAGTAVLAAGIAAFATAAVSVAVLGNGTIRFSADTAGTIPMWHPWLAAAVGIGLILITPNTQSNRSPTTPFGWPRQEAVVLLALGVTFTVSLTALGPDEPNYTASKLGLLLICPLVLFAVGRLSSVTTADQISEAGPEPDDTATGLRWWPAIPVAGWTATYLALASTHPRTGVDAGVATVLLIVLIGFLLNAVLEEFFYRRWLQTRWQGVLGGVWPAILVSSLIWASWHIAIQGTGNLPMDLANVVANQGITGLFLGLMWRRYAVMWPLLIAHGILNANPFTLF